MKGQMKFITLFCLGALALASCIPAETTIVIVKPTEDAKVDQFLTVDGESQLLPDGSVIWVVVFLPRTGMYYPQNDPAAMQANGEWTAVAYIGQENESGLAADVIAVVADKSAQNAFRSYLSEARDKQNYPGMASLPSGAVIYDRVRVVRK